MFVSEAVLAKLGEAQFVPPADEGWEGEAEYAAVQEQLTELTAQWNAKNISNELFFKLAPAKEAEVHRLRGEKARHDAALATRQIDADTTIAEIRRRWYLPEDGGGLAISVKRTYIRKALHTVIIHPAGKGNKKFNPDHLELIWRED